MKDADNSAQSVTSPSAGKAGIPLANVCCHSSSTSNDHQAGCLILTEQCFSEQELDERETPCLHHASSFARIHLPPEKRSYEATKALPELWQLERTSLTQEGPRRAGHTSTSASAALAARIVTRVFCLDTRQARAYNSHAPVPVVNPQSPDSLADRLIFLKQADCRPPDESGLQLPFSSKRAGTVIRYCDVMPKWKAPAWRLIPSLVFYRGRNRTATPAGGARLSVVRTHASASSLRLHPRSELGRVT